MELAIWMMVSAVLAAGVVGNVAEGDEMLRQRERNLLGEGTPLVPADFGGKRPRMRRMSCEALSFPLPYGQLNHAACASYCFVSGQNFRGQCKFGWCKCK